MVYHTKSGLYKRMLHKTVFNEHMPLIGNKWIKEELIIAKYCGISVT